jgi:hypothetical protein
MIEWHSMDCASSSSSSAMIELDDIPEPAGVDRGSRGRWEGIRAP